MNDRHACNFNFALTFNSLDLNKHQQMAQEAQQLSNLPNKFEKLLSSEIVSLPVSLCCHFVDFAGGCAWKFVRAEECYHSLAVTQLVLRPAYRIVR